MFDSSSTNWPGRVLSGFVLLVSVAWIYWYATSNPAAVDAIRDVSVGHLAMLSVLILGIFATNGLFTMTVLAAYDMRISLRESFQLSVATTAANYILPGRYGAGLRAVYLKGRVGFRLVDFLVTLSGLSVISLGVNGLLGICSVALLAATGRPFDPWVASAFFVAVAVAATLIAASTSTRAAARVRFRPIAEALAGWQRLQRKPRLMVTLVAIAVGQTALMLLQTIAAFHAIRVAVPLADALFFTCVKGLALLTTITPGALGVVEWLSVYMAKHLSFSPEQAFAAQGLMRAVTIAAALTIGPIAALFLGTAHRRRQALGSERC